MLQATLSRLEGVENLGDPIVICNFEHRFLVAEQLQQIGIKNPIILLEPVGKNTAPAIAAAAHYIEINSARLFSEDTVSQMLILSADHIIQDIPAFHHAIKIASKQAEKGKLATFGIIPTHPNTGYGYIKTETIFYSQGKRDEVGKIKAFKEKPNQQTAERYLKEGNYLWNSGMFMFQARVLINELVTYSPEIVKAAKIAINNAIEDLDFIRMAPFELKKSKEVTLGYSMLSIDYALMEKTDQSVVVPLDAGWNDIGSWGALYEVGSKDQNNNVIRGDVISVETTNSYINASHHMIATIGVDSLIIVDTPDATLVATKDKNQQVKQIVEQLQQKDRCEEQIHRKVYRPWGWYDSIESGENFQVKRLYVNPGESLSLQLHRFRAEHWVVVKGVATVENNGKLFTLKKGESTYIPKESKHFLANRTDKPLEVIEVQSGSYLGEDDIERFEDTYGRVSQ